MTITDRCLANKHTNGQKTKGDTGRHTDLQVHTQTGKQKIKMRPYVLLLLKYLNNK